MREVILLVGMVIAMDLLNSFITALTLTWGLSTEDLPMLIRLRHHGSGMLRTKDYVQSLPHPINTNGFSNMEPLPLPISMCIDPQSPVHGMELDPGGYADQTSPMQVSGDMSCSDVGCLVVANEAPVKGTQPVQDITTC